MPVTRITEIIASSPNGWYEAVQEGFKRATKTLRGIEGFEVTNYSARVKDGKIVEYRVRMNILFVLEN